MKTSSVILLALAPMACAFAPQPSSMKSSSTAVNGALDRMEWKGYYTNLNDDNIKDKIPDGNAVFDPFGFTDIQDGISFYREAEIKHCRLAMLAAANWYV